MYFLVLFAPTGERAIYQNDKSTEKLTVKNLLEWIYQRFHFESSTGESGNRCLSLSYDGTELQPQWFLEDINIRFGATVKCVVKEERIPDYRLFLPIRNETFDIFDSTLHPIETTILQLRIVASRKSGLPLSAFRLTIDKNTELFDHVRLSQYDIDYRATLTIQTWVGWSDFFTYAIKGYTKAVLKLLSSDELVRQYMMQVALYIAAHYGNVDLARALLQLGARADHPVGHHPSRQWCSSESLHPEYFRCPIHEAIISQQVGIVLLFGTRDPTCIQKLDGYGVKPWRLALRQERNAKQHEIGIFVLTKQFGGTRLSNKVTVPHRYVFVLKQWAERAREHVYMKQGIQHSSLKKKPLMNNGESLLGYKILVDGFNNDFQDYYSTAEYAEEKTRSACVVLDERERIKLKHMEHHMKKFVENASTHSKSTSSNASPTQQKGVASTSITPDSAMTSVGKKLWSKVANLYHLETLLLRNSIELLGANLITDEATPIASRYNNHSTGHGGISRTPSSLSSRSSGGPYLPIRIRLFAPQLRVIKKMMYKPDKDGRTLRHLSGVEWARVQCGANNVWQTHRASTAGLMKPLIKQPPKIKESKKLPANHLPDIQRVGSSLSKIPLPLERRKVDYRIILRGNDNLHKEIMYEWEKAAHLSLPSLSIQSLTEASKFQRKSWIQQVDTAVQFAINHSRRAFKAAA